jgi:hypothetical protein
MPAIVNDAGSGLGLSCAGVTTGGGSDGNRTAAIIPTLDGLGAVGSTMPSPDEYLDVCPTRESGLRFWRSL